MKVIGISGTDGSGKDTIAHMLAERSWLFVSVSDILRDELKKRGAALSRENLRNLSAEWRRKQGDAVLVDKAVQQFERQKGKYKNLVISSLRHPGEAQRVHELGGKVVWIDAQPRIRYERLVGRKRGSEDSVTFEEFLSEEQAQMSHSGDRATLNLSGVKKLADIIIENSGNDIKAFKIQAKKALKDAKLLD